MDYKDFIKFGAKVRYSWRDYNYYDVLCHKDRISYEEKEAIVEIAGTPRNKDTKRFISLDGYIFADEIEVKVKFEDGDTDYVTLEDLSIYNEIGGLSFDELEKLRKEICIGSCYLSDYDNSFGIDKDILCGLCEGYLEYLDSEYGDNADEHDTPEEFANYLAA